MRRSRATLCLILLAVPAGASERAPRAALEPVAEAAAAVALLAVGSPGAARDLDFDAWCDPQRTRAPMVELRWAVTAEGAREQRLDVSRFRDGFDKGRFDTGLLPAGRDGAVLESPEPGINYFWRVLTRTEDGWVPSESGRFEVQPCPHDEAPEWVRERNR